MPRLAKVCKANDERTFARMRGNDVDAPIAAVRRPQFWSRGSIDRDSRFSVPPDLM